MSTVIEVNGLRKSYGDLIALDGIDLSISAGEVFALLGPNGAGKSTAVEILEGFRSRDSGQVQVLGVDPSVRGEQARIWRDRIGIVLQSSNDAGDLTVGESIRHFARYYSDARDPEEVIDAVGLREKVDSLIRTLSGGQRRRVDVALGIIGNPELLFLDEPTTGFDPKARRDFWALIRKLKDEGRTILLTTHYLDEAEALADRLAVINKGKIIEVATPSTLGGRATSLAHISWRENGVVKTERAPEPTALILELSARFGGEIPELVVKRSTLEDIYLEMIGGEDA